MVNPQEAKTRIEKEQREKQLAERHRELKRRQALERLEDLTPELRELFNAAKEMAEAHEPSYSNKWQYEDGWGKDHRCSYEEDSRVLKRLKKAIQEIEGSEDS